MKSLKRIYLCSLIFCFLLCLWGCGGAEKGETKSLGGNPAEESGNSSEQEPEDISEPESGDTSGQKQREEASVGNHNSIDGPYTRNTKIAEVASDPVFGDYGRLIFPADDWYYHGETLGELTLTWYNNMDPDKTVEIANYIRTQADAGEPVFYDIYSDEEKAADPAKEDTGIFFFRGNPGERFAVCNAGGGFAYVGAMQDSFPHALELSKMGYNAFALIYRPGAQTACEDLARAISFIFAHADELEVSTDSYSLWGGSAGGRMAAYLGSYGTAAFGGDDLPGPGAVIMQYTGHSEYTEEDPPTYACVGENDGIASWRVMESRLNAMQSVGIDTEFHHYPGLRHGFGIGTGTVAEGWIEDAVAFWEKQSGGRLTAAHDLPPDEPVLSEIEITAGEYRLAGVLFDNETGREMDAMLPLTVSLWNPAPGFAKAFNLPTRIPDTKQRTRQYEKGGLAYWYEGPSVAMFYGNHLPETIVPVVTVGRINSDVDFLENYEGEITIVRKEEENL